MKWGIEGAQTMEHGERGVGWGANRYALMFITSAVAVVGIVAMAVMSKRAIAREGKSALGAEST